MPLWSVMVWEEVNLEMCEVKGSTHFWVEKVLSPGGGVAQVGRTQLR